MVLDRIEGKVPQPVEQKHENKESIHQFSEAELTEMLRERMGNMPRPEQPKTTQSGETLN